MTVCCRRSRCQRAMRWRWVRRGRLIRRATGTSILPVHHWRGFELSGVRLDEQACDEGAGEGQREDVVDLAVAGVAVEDERGHEDAGEVRQHDGLARPLAAPAPLAD